MDTQKRYQAIQVRRWDLLREKGYGFLVAEGGQKKVVFPAKKYRPLIETGEKIFFHFTNLPPEIRHWFARDYPGEPLLPTVSFTIGQTDKGEVAENIRLEPHLNREVIWRNNGQLLALQLGQSVENWPDADASVLATSDFWICEVFKILPGCESGDGYIARIHQKFVLGEDKITEKVHPSLAEDLQSYMMSKFKDGMPQIFNQESLAALGDRLNQLHHSFAFQLPDTERHILIDRLTRIYADILTDELVYRLAPYLPGLVELIWQQKSQNLPLLALDLESDGETIWEFALVGQTGELSNLQNPSDEQLKSELTKIKPGHILVGHKIKEWDLPILRKKGCEVDHFEVIDTLWEEMQLNPLRLSYALDTAHTAVKDAQKTLELARNQYLRKSGLSEVQKSANQEADSFFLHFHNNHWQKAIPSLLKSEAKTLIIGPDEYAYFLMLPPVAQVIQPTAKPCNFHGNGQKLFERYVTEIEKLGYTPIAELAPGILRHQWDLSPETSVPDIPLTVKIVYCSVKNYLRPDIRSKINHWQPENIHLLFPESFPLQSRQYIRTLSQHEVEEKIHKTGGWTRFAVGRSYVSLDILGLKIADLVDKSDNTYGLTRFWLEKTVKGEIQLWGCLNQEEFDRHFDRHFEREIIRDSIDNQPQTTWLLPIIRDRETEALTDFRLTPETPYRADYWAALLPLVDYYSQQSNRIILAVNESAEIPQIEDFLLDLCSGGKLKFETIEILDNPQDNLRIKIRQLIRQENIILIIPMQRLEASIRELQVENLTANAPRNFNWRKLTIILESLPVNLIPVWQLKSSDWSFESYREELEDSMENEQNPDGEFDDEALEDEEQTNEKEAEANSDQESDRRFCLEDKVLGCISVLQKIGFWLSDSCPIRLVCLDPRLKAANFTATKDWLKRDSITELRTIDGVTDTAKRYFYQPGNLEFYQLDENQWKEAIAQAFLFGSPLRDEQFEYLKNIMPRELDHQFISLPTGGGKSIIFQAPALYRGYSTHRLTVVISPLKALIKDQERSLWEKGFISTVIGLTGDMTSEEIEDSYRQIRGGECLLLYTAPERFRSKRFRAVLAERFNRDNSGPEYWVFDEAHCLSMWGLDFRPDYFYAAKFVKHQRENGRNSPILLLSATLNEQVIGDLQTTLNLK
jgi:hypothetical protein